MCSQKSFCFCFLFFYVKRVISYQGFTSLFTTRSKTPLVIKAETEAEPFPAESGVTTANMCRSTAD